MTERDQRQTKGFVIRELRPSDTELFRLVRIQALEDSPDAYVETLEQARACDWEARTGRLFLSAPPDRVMYVACVGAVPVGMIFAGYRDHNDCPFLAAMWVHPDFRRQGVGRALVMEALAFLSSVGPELVSLWVTESHAGVFQFYESLGFRRSGASSLLRPGSEIMILEMCRSPGPTPLGSG